MPFKRRHSLLLVIISLTTAAGFAACRRADLPDRNSPEYAKAVRAFYVGLSALQVGDDVRAEQKLKEATQLAPDEPAAWADLGLLFMRQRQFEQAAENLEKARQLAPDNPGLYVLLGQLESARGNYAEAVKHFRKAGELDPKNLKALYALSREVEREGEAGEQEVLSLLQKILEAQPRNLSVRLDVARLAAKRGDAELFNRMMRGFAEDSAAWPPEAQEQLAAVRAASAGGNPRSAAPRVQFLRNVLVRLPEYRQSRLAVEDPPEILSEPFTRFLRLESPSPNPAPPDEALTYNVEPADDSGPAQFAGAVSLTGEGAPARLFADGREMRLTGGVKLAFPGGPDAKPPAPNGIAALDFDYDFKTDLAAAGEGGFRLYRQESPTAFVDVTARANLPSEVTGGAYVGAWPADIEADGDLDIMLAAKEGPPVVLRNNGDGSFAVQRPFEGVTALRDFAWADLDGDGDPEASMLDAQGRAFVFTNERAGQFRPRPLPANVGPVGALGVADVNNDGRFDLLLRDNDDIINRLSDKDEGASWDAGKVLGKKMDTVPSDWYGEGIKLFSADLDNNGGIDLVVSHPRGTRAWLSDAAGNFKELDLPDEVGVGRVLAVADADADGRLDLLGVSVNGRGFRAAARGSKNYHWQLIRPRAANASGDQRINSFGVGGEMETRAGLLVQKQLITGPVVHFGLGDQTEADVVRVVWPNGSVRAEFELKADQSVLAEQRLKGSCPSLFAFDGKGMSFVKDCAPWSPAIGLRINSYQTAKVAQTEEWVKIRGDQLAPREGYYDLRITAELWETYYLDRYALAVVDHPAGTEVFVDERTANNPPALKVYTLDTPRAVAGAWDDAGADVSDIVKRLDGRHLDTFGRGAYQGVTRDHFVEVELGEEAPREGPLWLVAHGWLHPTDASINVAISQGRQAPPRGLSLEVADGRGGWTVAKPDLGFPAGKNKTILVDLKDVFTAGAPRRLRLRTNMEIYWDALEWASEVTEAPTRVTLLDPSTADLRYRGFSEMRSANPSSPETPTYERVAATGQRWRDLVGYYTRFGDVRELLSTADDRVVIANAGDELVLRFPAQAKPAAGFARDYVLVGNGWIKDGDYNSMFSKTVLPLPSRDREYYTELPARLEDDPVYRRHPEDWQSYHTRYVTPHVFNGGLWTR
ncbi:MAG TPA: FG-GAP-like repeat-containing protein [Pyrinomonadaceae bacterium]|nr:FG-GAP-like repeat-containing protein [Pyrinomonadaceae bacterium]